MTFQKGYGSLYRYHTEDMVFQRAADHYRTMQKRAFTVQLRRLFERQTFSRCFCCVLTLDWRASDQKQLKQALRDNLQDISDTIGAKTGHYSTEETSELVLFTSEDISSYRTINKKISLIYKSETHKGLHLFWIDG